VEKIMKNQVILLASTLLLWCAATATASEVKVIANSSVAVTSVSSEELKGVFLGTKSTLADGTRAEPVLMKSGAVHEAFVKNYLGKTDAALQTYYRSLVFTGKGAFPKTVASDAEVIATVSKTKGAIGYVGSASETPGVKTLAVK
jgi:ABC-type phosphate transport system substrate-binding protein